MADYSEQYELKLQLEDDGIIEKLSGVDKALSKLNKTTTVKVNTSGLSGVSSTLNSISSGLSKISQSSYYMSQGFSSIGSSLSRISAVSLAPVVGGLTKAGSLTIDFVKDTIQYGMTVEQAKMQLEAQNVTGAKLESTFKDITDFANVSPFDVANMTEAVSQVNAYVGNIDKAVNATKVFGTSLYASGRNASSLGAVARNLGQLDTGSFTKMDYNELIKGVPSVSAALRETQWKDYLGNLHQGIKGWDDFKGAIGDNPETQEIEKTANALDLVTSAVEKYNSKTHAFEKSNSSLTAKMGNMVGQFQTVRDDVLKSSGAYDKFTDVFVAFSNRINSPEMKSLLSNIFKSSLPYLDKLEKGINNFNLNQFITGFKNGFDTVKTTITGIADEVKSAFNFAQNLPFIGDFIRSLKTGLTGGQGDFGQFIGNWLSSGLKLGFTGIKFSFIGKGLNLFSTITQVLASGFGGAGSISKFISSRLSKEVSTGISTGINSGMSATSVVSGAASKNTFGKVFSGLNSIVNNGLKIAAGVQGVRLSNEVISHLHNLNLKQYANITKQISDEIPTPNTSDAKVLQDKLNAFKNYAELLSKIDLSTTLNSITTTISESFIGVGGALAAGGEIATGFGVAPVGAGFSAAGKTLQISGLLLQLNSFANEVETTIHVYNEGKVVDIIGKLNDLKIPDMNVIANKTKQIKAAMDKLNEAVPSAGVTAHPFDFIGIGTILSNMGAFIGELTKSLHINNISKLVDLSTQLNKMPDLSKIDLGSKIKALREQIVAMDKQLTDTTTYKSGGNDVSQTIGQALTDINASLLMADNNGNAVQVSDITNKIKSLNDLSSKMSEIGNIKINPAKIIGGIKNVFNSLKALKESFSIVSENSKGLSFNELIQSLNKSLTGSFGTVGTGPLSLLSSHIKDINSIMNGLNSIPDLTQGGKVDINKKVSQISDVMSSLIDLFKDTSANQPKGKATKFFDTNALSSIISSVNSIIPIMTQLGTMSFGNNITTNLKQLKQVSDGIVDLFKDTSANQPKGKATKFFDANALSSIISSVNSIIPIMTQLGTMSFGNNITTNLKQLKQVSDGIVDLFKDTSANQPKGKATQFFNASALSSVISSVNSIIPIMNQLGTQSFGNGVLINLQQLKDVTNGILNLFKDTNANQSGGVDPTNFFSATTIQGIIDTVNKVIPIMTQLGTMSFGGNVADNLSTLKTTISSITGMFTDTVGTNEGTPTTFFDPSTILNQVNSITQIAGKLQEISNLKIPDVSGTIQSISDALSQIQKLAGGDATGGLNFANTGGIPTAGGNLGSLSSNLSGVAGAIIGIANAITSLASTAGSLSGLHQAIAQIGTQSDTASTKVKALIATINAIPPKKTVTITAIDNATPTLQAIANYQIPTKIVTVSADVSAASSAISQLSAQASNIKTVTLAKGGPVGYFAKGGSTFSNLFKARGQDTIPAMLSQGEYVIKRSAANQLGLPLLDALNSGNLARAYDFMSQRVANTVSSVRNYTTNYNNNAQVNQYIYNDAQQYNGYRNLRAIVRGL